MNSLLKLFSVVLIFSLNSISSVYAKHDNELSEELLNGKESWIFSTKNDNFGEYDISHDPDDKATLKRFIKYQNQEIKHLEGSVQDYLNAKGLKFKIRKKFDNLGIIAVDIYNDNSKKLDLKLPSYIHSHKKKLVSLAYFNHQLNTNPEQIDFNKKDHYSNDKLNFKDSYPKLGKNINVFILDTGIRESHKEFNKNIHLHKINTNNSDDNGHGTHVAGVIAGKKAGFSVNANLYISKVLNASGSGDDLSIYNGLNWVVQKCSKIKGRCILSLSLGGANDSLENKTINSLDRLGILVVSAAGNDSTDACELSPASAAGALTVASANIYTQKLSYFSNYGSCVNIIADGENIISSWYDSDTSYNSISGTSMATPHVSGVAALVWGEQPTLSNQELKWYLVSLSKLWILGYPFLVM
tara:strand:- start:14851 stop:16089 length:1239 start_codon:yes stop_codon:yes gene_type:complete